MKNELISIVLPVFNSESTIEKCIDSILEQSYSNYELIIINDGSTDDSLNKILKYKDFKNIKIISTHNGGVSKARNLGLRYVQGTYVTFIDADDTVQKNYLKSLKEGYNKKVDISIIGFNEISNNQIISKSSYTNCNVTGVDLLNHIFDFDGPLGYVWNKLWKVRLIKENNIYFDENSKMAEDLLFNIKYLGHVKKGHINGMHQYNYLKDGDSLSETFYISKKKDRQFVDNYLEYKRTATRILAEYKKIKKYTKNLKVKNAEANIVQINLGLLRNLSLNNVNNKDLKKRLKKENFYYQNSYFTSSMCSLPKKGIYLMTMYLPKVMKLIDVFCS